MLHTSDILHLTSSISLLMPVGPLLTVFGFLTSRAATVGPGDVLLFLGLGLYLVVLLPRTTAPTKGNTINEDILEVKEKGVRA